MITEQNKNIVMLETKKASRLGFSNGDFFLSLKKRYTGGSTVRVGEWVDGVLEIWGPLMSLFGAQLCVCP